MMGDYGTEQYDSYDSRYMDSYKPETPSIHGDENMLPQIGTSFGDDFYTKRPDSAGDNMGKTMTSTLMTQEALEDKRRKALREKEREAAARQRQRELMTQKREMELKKKMENEIIKREQEALRIQELEREEAEREERRMANMKLQEEKALKEEQERRRMAQVEKKREHALRLIEMQRLREEEAQRIKREVILRKRKEMERVRDEAERMFASKKRDEMERKVYLVEEMKKKREDRLLELEKRRTNPLLVQQEKEFNQLIELQASVGRLQTKLEQVQTSREDVRERLLEARHVVEMLEIEERQLSISVEEVETDLKKLRGYQEGLSRLVSTRYDDAEYEKAVITIQRIYRGHRHYNLGKHLKKMKYQQELEAAALKIQKVQRGRIIRRMQKDDRKVRACVRLQCAMRGKMARRRLEHARSQLQKQRELFNLAARIQNAYRCCLARRAVALRREEKRQQEAGRHHGHRRHAQKPHGERQGAQQKGRGVAHIERAPTGDRAPHGGLHKQPSQSSLGLQRQPSMRGSMQAVYDRPTRDTPRETPREKGPKSRSPQKGAASAPLAQQRGGVGAKVEKRLGKGKGGEEGTMGGPKEGERTPREELGGWEVTEEDEIRAREGTEMKKKAKPKHPLRTARGGELGRIYMSAPKDKSNSSLSQNPRMRRFVPTSATAAVASSAEESGTFAPLMTDMWSRDKRLAPGEQYEDVHAQGHQHEHHHQHEM